jgi:ubiquinone/menaquinone biosynthesis C-methylase UbiE
MAHDEWEFASLAGEYAFFLEHSRDWTAESITLNFVPQGCGRAIDLGCGSGAFTRRLAEHARNVIGLDVSQPFLEMLHEQAGLEVGLLCADVHYQPFAEGAFDFVTSTAVLHETDLSVSLPALRRLLAPGGRMAVWDLVDTKQGRALTAGWGAVVASFRNLSRTYGWRAAVRVSRFMVSRLWMRHIQEQKLPGPAEFRDVYGEAFPGCRFVNRPIMMGVLWQVPSR